MGALAGSEGVDDGAKGRERSVNCPGLGNPPATGALGTLGTGQIDEVHAAHLLPVARGPASPASPAASSRIGTAVSVIAVLNRHALCELECEDGMRAA